MILAVVYWFNGCTDRFMNNKLLHSREVFITKIPRLILFSRRCVIELPRVPTVP